MTLASIAKTCATGESWPVHQIDTGISCSLHRPAYRTMGDGFVAVIVVLVSITESAILLDNSKVLDAMRLELGIALTLDSSLTV